MRFAAQEDFTEFAALYRRNKGEIQLSALLKVAGIPANEIGNGLLFAIERKLYIRTVVDHEAGALFHSRLLRKRSNIPINGEVFKGCWQRTGLSVTVHCIDTNLEIAIHSDFAAHRHIDRVGDRRPILVIIAVIGGERSSFLHNLQIDACLWIGVRGCMFRELAVIEDKVRKDVPIKPTVIALIGAINVAGILIDDDTGGLIIVCRNKVKLRRDSEVALYRG